MPGLALHFPLTWGGKQHQETLTERVRRARGLGAAGLEGATCCHCTLATCLPSQARPLYPACPTLARWKWVPAWSARAAACACTCGSSTE